MAVPRAHLPHAPAREALIDIRFEPQISLDQIDRFVAGVASSFESQLDLVEAVVGFGPSGPTSNRQSIVGRRLDNPTSHYVLQCRTGGFTLSRLSPYGEWPEFRAEALRWWESFSAVVGTQTITRIAVRYINEIKIPLPMGNFDEFLTCPPRVPAELPQGLSGFLYRAIVPDDHANCTAIITQALEGVPASENGGSVTVLLDIDVFRQVSLGTDRVEQAWLGLDELRTQKNRVFFAHVTEKAVEMFL